MKWYQLPIFAFFCLLITLIQPENISASWPTDLTPPDCSISYNPSSLTPATGTNITIQVSANDSANGNNGILSINLSSSPTVNLTGCNTQLGTSPATMTCNWTTTSGTYNFSANATDGEGNTNTGCSNPQSFNVNPQAWIQTTNNGDIHSNDSTTGISLPGGP